MLTSIITAATFVLAAATAADDTRMPDCVNEDGSGGPVPCIWDGDTRGNGVGPTYVVLERP